MLNDIDIKTIQQKLNNLGYYNNAIDGIFGPLTQAALINFQYANNIAENLGVVDEYTQNLLLTVNTSDLPFTNFKEAEIMNPYFDDCPGSTFAELPIKIKNNLFYTMEIADKIINYTKSIDPTYGGRLTSTWRPNGRRSSPHYKGKAVDLQILSSSNDIYLQIMDWAIDEPLINDCRLLLEWRGRGLWIHIDRKFRNINKKAFLIGYPKNGTMVYTSYEGKYPYEYK